MTEQIHPHSLASHIGTGGVGGPIPRRAVLAGMGLGAASLLLGVPGVIDAPSASATTLSVQYNWRWCRKCQGLAFNGAVGSPGPCPAGGRHDHAYSGNYLLEAAEPHAGQGEWQPNWRWCKKCQALTFAGAGTVGACSAPEGGQHDHSGSGNYALLGVPEGEPSTSSGQANWRWCSRCQALTFGGASAAGACPGGPPGTVHTHAGSGNYYIEAEQIEDRWRYCSRCRSLVSGTAPCAGGGQHQLGAANYCVPHDNYQLPSAQDSWFACAKCLSLFYGGGSGAINRCPGGGGLSHEVEAGKSPKHYQLISGVAPAANEQNNWQWCSKCGDLVFAGAATPGSCAAGNQHATASGAGYVLATNGLLPIPSGGGGTPVPGPANLAFSGTAGFDQASGNLVVPFANTGGTASGNFSVRLVLDSQYTSYLSSASLAPGQAGQARLNLNGLSWSQHGLIVVLDALNQVSEASEADNEKTVYFSINSMGFVYILTP